MNDQIKVCHVVGGIVGGGVEQVIVNYCAKIPEIHFDLLYQYEPNQACLKKLNDARINCIRVPEKKKNPISHFWTMYTLFKNGNYNAVHCHLDWFLNWSVCLCALLAGVKKRIAHHHHVYQEKTIIHKVFFFFFQFINRLFATHYLACSSQAAVNGWGKSTADAGEVIVLNNAIDLKRFKFDEKMRSFVRLSLNIHNQICIGHVGRFCYQKNQDFLLDVFKKVHEVNQNSVLMMIGDGPEKKKIEERVSLLGLHDFVYFIESKENVAPYYSAMDVFCLPSRWEGLGMVAVEAQVNGLPCLTSTFVPYSAKISEDFLPLDLTDPETWARNLLDRKNFKHNNMSDTTNFDIEQQFVVLKKLYLD